MTGNVIPVDINLPAPRATTSGCEAADFAGLNFERTQRHRAHPARQRCSVRQTKALNAQAAGAEAVIIFNQGNARP